MQILHNGRRFGSVEKFTEMLLDDWRRRGDDDNDDAAADYDDDRAVLTEYEKARAHLRQRPLALIVCTLPLFVLFC